MAQHQTGATPDTELLLTLPFVPWPSRHDEGDDGEGDDGQQEGDDAPDEGDDGGDDTSDDGKAAKKTAAKKAVPAKKVPTQGDGKTDDLMGDVDPDDPRWKSILTERQKRQAATKEADTARRELAAALKKIQDHEDEKKSDLEKAQAAAERALAREKAANVRAVTSELRSAAIQADALDPSDIVDFLASKAETFVGDDGIDTTAIETAVEELLAKKPHWRKPPAGNDSEGDDTDNGAGKKRAKPAPKPDPGQGSRGGNSTPDWSDPKVLAAEKARLGLPSYG